MARKGLEIAFFGSSLVSAYWNGAATYYRGIIKSLASRGHRVTFYEPDAYERQLHRDMADPPWSKVVVYGCDGTSGVSAALEDARTADLIVKASGVGVFDELLESSVLQMKKSDNMVVFWDVDAPATLDRVEQNAGDPFLPLIPLYDAVFTYGGGTPVVEAYRALGASVCIPIYNALDPETHRPESTVDRFSGDLGFLGNRLPDRESRVEEFFLRPAAILPKLKFQLGGNGWADKQMPSNVTALGHVYTHEHNAFNCSNKAVLNINRDSMARYGFSPPTRVFEAAGAGACLITDSWEGIEMFLEPGKEVLCANDGAEVVEHLQRIDQRQRREIGEAARKRVLGEHTYQHRAEIVERTLRGRQPGSVLAG